MTIPESSDAGSVWAFVPPESITPPASPMDTRVQEGVSAVRSWFRDWSGTLRRWWPGPPEDADETETTGADSSPNGPQPASGALLDRIAPAPDWSGAVAALDAALTPWREAPNDVPALVLTSCYHGAPSILSRWAKTHGCATADPPSRSHLTQSGTAAGDWLNAQVDSASPWVLPHLEQCFVRSPRGLAFVRELLDCWAAGTLGPGVIGCDPHAWAYIQKVWPGQIPHRLALQPFSADMLAQWFRTLAESHQPDGAAPVSFRRADGGSPVLPEQHTEAHKPNTTSASDNEVDDSYLNMLADFSQGDPNIARILWRRSLLVPPDASLPDSPSGSPHATQEPPHSESESEQIIWVRSWNDVERPAFPDDVARLDMFVLHALLLHGGLSADQLCPLLPSSPHAVRHRLRTLRNAGIVTQASATWHLTPAGYPTACDMLRSEAYLPDPHDT